MKKSSFIAAVLVVVLGFLSVANAQKTEVTIQPGKVIGQVDPKTYGHFLEHIYNSCNGGLWGELVWNRSFEAGNSNTWQNKDGVYINKSTQGNPRLVFGSPNWTDYELSFDVKKTAGQEGFLVLYRIKDGNYYWVNVGGWDNKRSGLEFGTIREKSDSRSGAEAKFAPFEPIATGQTYKVRLVVSGTKATLYINDKVYMESDSKPGAETGCAGIGAWQTAVEFSNLLVKDFNGKVLFDGSKETALPDYKPEVRFWDIDGYASLIEGDARNSDKFVRFTRDSQFSQQHYDFQKGENYDYSFWTRGKGTVDFQGTKHEINSDKWTKTIGSFTVTESNTNATLQMAITVADGKTVDLDQVSIMPRSWKENYFGMRPDLLKAIKDLRPPVIRWPGGCYASMYRWKDGIGPQDDRRSYPAEMWNDKDVNSFGIDEFVQMCRMVGAEPIMVVDLGCKQWTERVPGADKVDWITEAVEWVEYCNGPVTSKWGAVRAKNGHPEPYNIKYFELDNEVHWASTPYQTYVKMINEVVPKMKAIDPTIQIIACGSWAGPRDQWDSEIIKGASKNFDFLSTHRYDNPNGYARNPYENQKFFESRRQWIADSDNPNIKIFNSEWNAMCTDWRTGLHTGGILNCFENASDVLGIAAPALFLRHVSANAWDNALVNFDQAGWFAAPNYVVMKLWYDNYMPNRVKWTSNSADLTGEMSIINAVATASENGKTVVFKAVNNKMEAVELTITVEDATVKTAFASVVTPDIQQDEKPEVKLDKRNSLSDKNAIAPKPLATSVNGGTITVTMPSLSANLIRIELE